MGKLRKFYEKFKEVEKGFWGYIIYAILGFLFAFLFNQTLSFALNSEMPIVAVYSSSMQHDNAEKTHYEWLEKNLGYNRSFIDSWPFPKGLNVGDMPIIKGEENYNVGDIIVYKVEGLRYPIIHRIIKINEDGTFQTKGDNNFSQLPYELKVKKEQIIGRVIFIIPKIGYIRILIANVLGI